MGRRFYANDPYYIRWCGRWYTPGMGRYWKRQLSKARRRRAALELAGDYRRAYSRGLGYETECNYKRW